MQLVKMKERTGYEEAVCCMPHVRWEYPDDDASEEKVPVRGECEEPVFLVWRATHDITEAVNYETGGMGNTTSWTVECGVGHILASSDDPEVAEPYNPRISLGLDVHSA